MKFSFINLARAVVPECWHFSRFCPTFLRERIIRRTGLRVASGPLKGMRYIETSRASVLEPKLLGIYERELHPVIDEISGKSFTRIIDIGAAEGYYAVGLALRVPEALIWAFEKDESARLLLRMLAEKNDVASRVNVMGLCETRHLVDLIRNDGITLIVCDAEGGEATLLDPEVVPNLEFSHILVELHSKTVPGVEELLRRRFECTHRIQTIEQGTRSALDYPYWDFPVNLFPKVYLENAVSEFRQPWQNWMSWYWMEPRI